VAAADLRRVVRARLPDRQPITPPTARTPPARKRCDESLKVEITRVHGDNYRVYGARTVWLALNREGITAARCTVERLMSEFGLVRARRGRRFRTTAADTAALTCVRP
jgi:putative transposase